MSFTFGDPSGSHSEKYRLVLKPVAESGRGETPPTKSWLNENYGECETKTAMLARGWTYEITLHHAGTNIEDGSPDYDYLLSWSVPSCCGCVTNDPAGLICKDYTSDSFAGEGKVAKILVLDGGIWADYNRVDGIDSYDKSKAYRGRPLRHWYNDDDDEGDTNEGTGSIPRAGTWCGSSGEARTCAPGSGSRLGRHRPASSSACGDRCFATAEAPALCGVGRVLL